MNCNVTTVSGRLTKNPEMSYLPSGTPIAKMSLAIDDPRGKDKEKRTSFFPITVFGKTAESCGQYLEKGQVVIVNGKLQQERWETQDGSKRSQIVIIGHQVSFGQKARPKELAPAA